jgi:serine/threonine protein kinase
MDLDGRGLPDHPFWDMVWKSTTATDIFSLGSTFYTIMTGYWPYKSALPSDEEEDKWAYEDRVEASWKNGIYPDMEGVVGGKVMMGCWTKQYIRAEDILETQKVEMQCVITNEGLPYSPFLDGRSD